ncbi:uncharacterized protein LOC107748075 isoform X2 [Sinocyclocheilus rhinocerous]|uniref:uncharacterized protein LOC107748075 isoform X2 n=1 Tax=Sinocyclocheilus rhinocerous TaxID=307959 RepID=UPI0007B7E085|nr:PREDICTED: uncharacterized protein LOC107748075 isoform X2 [Sinocyclocheilus rhinocerous]
MYIELIKPPPLTCRLDVILIETDHMMRMPFYFSGRVVIRPGGGNVLKEYEDTGTISDDTRKVMVNILVAHMMETEGRVPHRLTKQKYGLGIITLFPSLRDPQGRTGYMEKSMAWTKYLPHWLMM